MPCADKPDFPVFAVRCLDVLYPLGSNAVGGAHVLVLPALEVKVRIIQGILSMLPYGVLNPRRK